MVKAKIDIKVKNKKLIGIKLATVVNRFLQDADSMKKANNIIQVELKKELESQGVQTQRIKKKTKDRRERLAKTNKTSRYYAKDRSNLHFTGQLVSSIFSKFIKRGTFELGVNDKRRKPYNDSKKRFTNIEFVKKTKKSKKLTSREVVSSNKEIAEGLINKGWRLFFFPRKKAPSRIAALFRRYIRRNKKL